MAEELSISQKATGWPAQIKDYFAELQLEMRRVTWPSWKQVRATTAVVIVSVFMFAAYFFVVDAVVTQIINKLFATFAK
ncbi:MAG TPA: preprotein translocase subunit SecE [Bryobacteraceae bacterium]|nr:preprotein translocase subunit SecE [Bryobacteraceae bacterium]